MCLWLNPDRLPKTHIRYRSRSFRPTCAYYLANMGHEVHVYEAESVAGGVLYWGIPEYRLPKAVLQKDSCN